MSPPCSPSIRNVYVPGFKFRTRRDSSSSALITSEECTARVTAASEKSIGIGRLRSSCVHVRLPLLISVLRSSRIVVFSERTTATARASSSTAVTIAGALHDFSSAAAIRINTGAAGCTRSGMNVWAVLGSFSFAMRSAATTSVFRSAVYSFSRFASSRKNSP